jgi:hypothetical protein
VALLLHLPVLVSSKYRATVRDKVNLESHLWGLCYGSGELGDPQKQEN